MLHLIECLDSEIMSASIRLQMQNLNFLPSTTPTGILGSLSTSDMSLAIESISTMFLKEYAVLDAILNDLRLDLPFETLSVYIITWRVHPHLDDVFVESLREKLKLFDQIISSRWEGARWNLFVHFHSATASVAAQAPS